MKASLRWGSLPGLEKLPSTYLFGICMDFYETEICYNHDVENFYDVEISTILQKLLHENITFVRKIFFGLWGKFMQKFLHVQKFLEEISESKTNMIHMFNVYFGLIRKYDLWRKWHSDENRGKYENVQKFGRKLSKIQKNGKIPSSFAYVWIFTRPKYDTFLILKFLGMQKFLHQKLIIVRSVFFNFL